jgi:DNA polymerase III epsilon subunit family exonuclease
MAEKSGRRLNLFAENYVVFDLETTGLSPNTEEIIEISGIRVRGHKIQEEFSTLVNPGRPIPPAATAINGITDQMVQAAPSPAAALEQFLDFAGKDILVGHNIHTFDMLFLTQGALKTLNRKVDNDYVDTLYLARAGLPQLSHHRLTDVAAYFHLETKGAHRALKDCAMNQECYEKLRELGEKQDAPACPKCGSLLMKRKGRYGEFWGCSAFPQCRFTQNI